MIHHHGQEHEAHSYHHHHDAGIRNINKVFITGIILNTVYVVIEAIAGFATNSLALISDAGHNLSDVAGLLISVLAYRLSNIKPTANYTYGFNKLTIFAGMANAIILSVAVGSIGYSAIERLFHPTFVNGISISVYAFIGILVNGFSALLFQRQNQHDINIKGAYLHLMMDALISAGVVVAGILISFTGWSWLDPLVSIFIMLIIVISTWRLLKSTFRLFLDGVPENIDLEIIKALKKVDENIENLHHIHVWPISSNQNALTAHVLIRNSINTEHAETIKEKLKHSLQEIHIHHATLEMEYKNCGADKDHH